MTPKERAAMQQAIEFIVDCEYGKAELALREALAEQAEQEPVAWMYVNDEGECEQIEYGEPFNDPSVTPLYAAPLAKQDTHATHVVRTKDLTDDEIVHLVNSVWFLDELMVAKVNFARAVIAADREKNK